MEVTSLTVMMMLFVDQTTFSVMTGHASIPEGDVMATPTVPEAGNSSCFSRF